MSSIQGNLLSQDDYVQYQQNQNDQYSQHNNPNKYSAHKHSQSEFQLKENHSEQQQLNYLQYSMQEQVHQNHLSQQDVQKSILSALMKQQNVSNNTLSNAYMLFDSPQEYMHQMMMNPNKVLLGRNNFNNSLTSDRKAYQGQDYTKSFKDIQTSSPLKNLRLKNHSSVMAGPTLMSSSQTLQKNMHLASQGSQQSQFLQVHEHGLPKILPSRREQMFDAKLESSQQYDLAKNWESHIHNQQNLQNNIQNALKKQKYNEVDSQAKENTSKLLDGDHASVSKQREKFKSIMSNYHQNLHHNSQSHTPNSLLLKQQQSVFPPRGSSVEEETVYSSAQVIKDINTLNNKIQSFEPYENDIYYSNNPQNQGKHIEKSHFKKKKLSNLNLVDDSVQVQYYVRKQEHQMVGPLQKAHNKKNLSFLQQNGTTPEIIGRMVKNHNSKDQEFMDLLKSNQIELKNQDIQPKPKFDYEKWKPKKRRTNNRSEFSPQVFRQSNDEFNKSFMRNKRNSSQLENSNTKTLSGVYNNPLNKKMIIDTSTQKEIKPVKSKVKKESPEKEEKKESPSNVTAPQSKNIAIQPTLTTANSQKQFTHPRGSMSTKQQFVSTREKPKEVELLPFERPIDYQSKLNPIVPHMDMIQKANRKKKRHAHLEGHKDDRESESSSDHDYGDLINDQGYYMPSEKHRGAKITKGMLRKMQQKQAEVEKLRENERRGKRMAKGLLNQFKEEQRQKLHRMKQQEQADEEDKDIEMFSQRHYSYSSEEDTYSEPEEDEILTGEDALENFQDLYRNIDKLKQVYEANSKNIKSPLLKYLQEIQKANMMPRTMGFVHRKKTQEINLDSFLMSKKYVDAFCSGLKLSKNIIKLNLRRNQLSSRAVIQILKNIRATVVDLDFSYNGGLLPEIFEFMDDTIFQDPQFKLERLQWEGCDMNDESCNILCKSVGYSRSIKFLNISKNNITVDGCEAISSMLEINKSLLVLFLHWNKLGPKGGALVATGLQSNDSLQVLDLSFCSIGRSCDKQLTDAQKHGIHQEMVMEQKKQAEEELQRIAELKNPKPSGRQRETSKDNNQEDVDQKVLTLEESRKLAQELELERKKRKRPAEEWREAFFRNKTLIHLDISYNEFDAEEIEIISEGLNKNHTILGIHTIGNQATTDAQGFLIPFEHPAQSDVGLFSVYSRMMPTIDMGVVSNKQRMELKANSNCWICEGWSEFKFQFKPQDKIDIKTVPVMLHLSCENFEGELLGKDLNDESIFTTMRMLPPGNVSFYFTIDGKIHTSTFNKVKEINEVQQYKKLERLQVPKCNVIENIIQFKQPITHTFLQNMGVIPRPPPKTLAGNDRLKTPWDFFKSVYKDYRPDNNNLLEQCFEWDWSQTKLDKLIKDETERGQIKKFIKTHFKKIREVYKHYAAMEPAGRVHSIGNQTFVELLQNCNNFIDHKVIKVADVEINLISTNANANKKSPLNPERQIVRHQMIEIFYRLSLDKYFKSQIAKTQYEAVTMAFENHFLPYIEGYDCHKWRIEQLWNEYTDVIFKRFEKATRAIYEANSGKYTLPGQAKFMSLEEFLYVVTNSGIMEDSFGMKEIGPLFNLSMMTQKDEISGSERHLNMTYIEFQEAIGRIADKCQYLNDFYPNYEARHPTKLDTKIQNLLLTLIKTSLPYAKAQQHFRRICDVIEEEINRPKATKYGISAKKY